MVHNPTIIIIPHYNNIEGLTKTIQSIHHRTGIDLLVIDDGSDKDQTPTSSLLEKLVNKNVSLNIISHEENRGITEALNFGLKYILEKDTHQYIARLDCGDTCVVNRFHLQEDFLAENKEIELVGSWVKWLNSETKEEVFSYRPATENKKIKKRMSIRCNLIHPSVMFRVSTVKKIGFYPSKYKAAEDYAYFFEIVKQGKAANIPKFLTQVEHNVNGLTNQNKRLQSRSKLKIVMKYGRKDLHFLYGIAFNLVLISTPAKLVHKIKSTIK